MISKIRFGEAVATPAASTTETKQPGIATQQPAPSKDSFTINPKAETDAKNKKEITEALKRAQQAEKNAATSISQIIAAH